VHEFVTIYRKYAYPACGRYLVAGQRVVREKTVGNRINTSFIVAQYSLFGIQVCACGCNLSRSRTSALCCSDNMGISRTCMTTALAWYIIIVFARERYATVQMEITK